MVLATCELVWIKQLLQVLKFCENEESCIVAIKQLFILPPIRCFMRDLNIEIVCNFVREKLLCKNLIT